MNTVLEKLNKELEKFKKLYEEHISMIDKYQEEIERLKINALRLEGIIEGLKNSISIITSEESNKSNNTTTVE